jgi:hypothetical protein
MADIRIKDLAVTAGSSSSDDYLAVDGATNGTRKLSAYSPTFGGNVVATGTLTVNSTTDSSSKDTGAIVTEGGVGIEKKLYVGTDANVGGNLTVSGGTVTSGTGTLTLNSSANTVVLQSAGATALTLDSSQNATFAGTVTVPNDKAIYLKEVSGTAQRFVLNSGDVIYIEPDQLHKISIGGSAVTNVGNGGIGVAGNSVFGGTIAIGNTVNTVSPTSPNRTITMVIGGTTYYLHAKTTND